MRVVKGLEIGSVFLLTCALFVSVPVSRDGFGLSWDTMNHHVYLGWVASQSRFHEDYFAAASQSYQFPYLYWPVYQLTQMHVDGWLAGSVWALLHATVCLPLWSIASQLIVGNSISAAFFRMVSVLFGVGNILVLRAPETSGNDVLAALPWLVGLAVGLGGFTSREGATTVERSWGRTLLCGLLGGCSVALKLSNGALVVFLPFVCAFLSRTWKLRVQHFLVCLMAVVLGFTLLYGWWGWQLWLQFGNPLFPFGDSLFEPIRLILGWKGRAG